MTDQQEPTSVLILETIYVTPNDINTAVGDHGGSISDITNSVSTALSSYVSAILDLANKYGGGIDQKTIEAAGKYMKTQAGILAAVGMMVDASRGDWNGVAKTALTVGAGLLAAAILPVGTPLIVGALIGFAAGAAMSWLLEDKDLIGGLADWYDAAMMGGKVAIEAMVDAYDGLVESLTDFFESMADAWDAALDTIGDFLADSIGKIFDGLEAISSLNRTINDFYINARSWIRRDPLVLDLDGNGIDAIGANGSVLFDHNGDGVKTGTGWVGPGDGLLVWDRNGNGVIDDGTELFGEDFVKSNGEKATNGFDALSDFDLNGDGVIDANDAIWSELRVWRDLSQDGVTHEGELFTLDELGIVSISITPTVRTINLGNGNQQTATASFTRADGTTGDIANLNFADNPFYREFSDEVEIADAVRSLPNMMGSGSVRDLREAASTSSGLAAILETYSKETTREGQHALLESLVTAWGASSDAATSVQAAEQHGYQLIYLVPGQSASSYEPYIGFGITGSLSGPLMDSLSDEDREKLLELRESQQSITSMISTLERFNGVNFVNVGEDAVVSGVGQRFAVAEASSNYSQSGIGFGLRRVYVTLSNQQIDLLTRSYDSLMSSVYGALVPQTRLQTYMDLIELDVGSDGIQFDFSRIESRFELEKEMNPVTAAINLIEFNHYAGNSLASLGWGGATLLQNWILEQYQSGQMEEFLQEVLGADADLPSYAQIAREGIFTITRSGNQILRGQDGAEIIVGRDEFTNRLYGGAGDDLLIAGRNDYLYGQDGDDTLIGAEGSWLYAGSGNDTLIGAEGSRLYGESGDNLLVAANNTILYGGTGSDVYRIGDDALRVSIHHNSINGRGVVEFGEGVAYSDATLSRDGNTLVMELGEHRVVFNNWFSGARYQVSEFQFGDGTVVDAVEWVTGHTLYSAAAESTTNQILRGHAGADVMVGNDLGTNSLYGGAGDDLLIAGRNDRLYGEAGDDTLVAASGSHLYGGEGSDRYVFRGDFHGSRVYAVTGAPNSEDSAHFADLTVDDLWFHRSGNDLLVDVIGEDNRVSFQNWFTNESNRIGEIHVGDAYATADQIDQLVLAMAAFTPVDGGVYSQVPEDVRNALAPTLSASWSTAA